MCASRDLSGVSAPRSRLTQPIRSTGRFPQLLEVRLDHGRNGPLWSEVFQRENVEAHFLACRLSDPAPDRLMLWLDVESAPERMEHLLHVLRRRPGARNLAIASLGRGRALFRVTISAPSICTVTHRAGGICVQCPLLSPKERDAWRVVLPRGAATETFLRDLAPTGSRDTVAISRLSSPASEAMLTRRQDRALHAAYDLGYFDYPRRGSLNDVARLLGIGRSATLEILRRATAKLAARRYGGPMKARGSALPANRS